MSQSGVLVSASPSKPKSTRYDDATAIIAPPRPSWMKGTAESNWTANSNKKQELKLDSKLVAAVKVEEHSNMMDEEAPFDAFRVASTHATPSLGESPSTAGPSRRSQATEIEDPAQAQRKRDEEALTIIEKLELGPKEFRGGNCEWKTVEPNSGIRLRSRSLEHTQVQANMEARYYLSPSVIYSIIRLGRNRQHFDVPVEGDWVTIAVVCGVKNSRTKDKKEREEDEDVDASEDEAKKQAKEKRAQQDTGPRGKVFYNGAQMSNKPMENHGRAKAFANVRLCALPPRKNGQLVTAGGDAMLNMLLFSADGETKDHRTGAVKYRGGSGGAYEKYWKLSVGTVIGVVSPKVLRPYGGKNQPHPTNSPLGITPNSEEDVFVIGQAKDLALCSAKKKDGEQCQSWVDTRVGKVCEFHMSGAAERSRGGRGEFASSTSTMRPRSKFEEKERFNYPRSNFGLKPSGPNNVVRDWQNDAGGQMYVVGGKTFSSNGAKRKLDSLFLSENMGREHSQKMSRRKAAEALEKEIQSLADQDQTHSSAGSKYLLAALAQSSESSDSPAKPSQRVKGPFHAEAIRRIGFDPRQIPNNQALDSKKERERLALIAGLRTNRVEPKLGPMPGTKSLSNVVAPSTEERFIDLSDDDE